MALWFALLILGVFSADETAPAPPQPAAQQACTDCHVHHDPTSDSAGLRPCPRNSAPEVTAEGAVPDVFLLDELSDLYVPVVFPHKLHADMTGMGEGCDVCHHHNPPGPILSCKACHNGPSNPGNLQQPGLKGAYHRQCLGCHREWTHETDCVTCHAKREAGRPVELNIDPTDIMGRLHPNVEEPDVKVYRVDDAMLEATPFVTFHHQEHTQLFGLKCVSCHERENCSSCHDAQNRKPHVRQDPHQDCMRCHQTQIESDCAMCHTETPSPGFNHLMRTGFDLDPVHNALTCTACHGIGAGFSDLSADCASCHASDWTPESFDHARTGRPLDDLHVLAGCLDCHTQGIGGPASCDACHTDGRTEFPAVQAAQN